ncbi:pfh1, partial [Symbiodinium microadriaticum]
VVDELRDGKLSEKNHRYLYGRPVEGCTLSQEERRSRYVKFEDADWKLEGANEPGLYPVLPNSRTWKLDKGRKHAVLKVSRKQIPLTPAFAITAHASQGKTLKAVMLDLNVDSKIHAAYGTVVASRVRDRSDVLILRPFPLWLFQRGATEGPSLLLSKLRGEHIDWQAMHDARWPKARCQNCKELKSWDVFAFAQWEMVRANRGGQCLACQRGSIGIKGPLKRSINATATLAKSVACSRCHFTKVEEAFPRAQLAQKDANTKRQCCACRLGATQLNCAVCGKRKPAKDFSPTMRTMPDDTLACVACQQQLSGKAKRLRTGWFFCRGCHESFPNKAAGNAVGDHCLNCSSRSTNQIMSRLQTPTATTAAEED